MNALAFLTAAMNLVPLLLQAGLGIEEFAGNVYNVIAGGSDPTTADWDNLHAQEAQLRAQLGDVAPPAAS